MRTSGLILLVLGVAAVCGRRQNQDRTPKEDHGTIIRCMAENYLEGEEKIKACRECFKKVGKNPFSEQGLPKAKECTKQFLKIEAEACASLISELSPGDMETGAEVIDCFDQTLETANYERCLGESTSSELNEVLTDGVSCVLESWKYGHEYVKNVTSQTRPGRGRFQRRRGRGNGKGKGKGKGMKKAFMKMMMIANCETANPDNEQGSTDCQQCFNDAVPKRGNKQSKAEIMSAIADCSEQHLSPLYDKCTKMMKSESSDKGETFQCYQRVLLSDLVSGCSDGISEPTADSLDVVMDCGKDQVGVFFRENASPKMLKKLEKMFGDDSSEEEEDDD